MKEVDITSFSPTSGDAGTAISVILADGLPAEPNSLMAVGGSFTNSTTGRVFPTPEVAILDPQSYRNFSISVPPEATDEGEYEFKLMLNSTGKVGEIIELRSISPFTIGGSAAEVIIRSVIPKSITREELVAPGVRIIGVNLDKIDEQVGFYTAQGGFAFRALGLTSTNAMIRMSGAKTSLKVGQTYSITADAEGGVKATSTARLEILPD